VFGEKYPDPVRVVSVGAEVKALLEAPTSPEWESVSVEFCGGTHLSNTSQAEDFVLIEESGIAKGVRRITALTRDSARDARERARALFTRLNAMKEMPAGPELLALSKAIKTEVRHYHLQHFPQSINILCVRWIKRWFRLSIRTECALI